MFEGEYLNGLRNGEGKEYYFNGQLMFEGEFKGNKIWNGKGYKNMKNVLELKEGKGLLKISDNNGNLLLEAVYLNGQKNGKVKEYYDNGKLKFEGEYLNGQKNGKAKEYNNKSKLIFEGEYLYNCRLKGKEYTEDKLEYEGEYLYDKKYNGKGYDQYGNMIYELKNGTGKVKEYDYNGKLIFEGEYLNGKRNGKAKEYWFGKLIFEGEYLNGKRNGKGKEYNFNDQLQFEVEYLNGKRKC